MQRMILYFLLTFLSISSHKRPVLSKRKPITTKSRLVQATSSVNCIAMNGMSNRIGTTDKMIFSLLCFIIVCISFLYFLFKYLVNCFHRQKHFSAVRKFYKSVFVINIFCVLVNWVNNYSK